MTPRPFGHLGDMLVKFTPLFLSRNGAMRYEHLFQATVLMACAMAIVLAVSADARQFRSVTAISTPENMPDDAEPVRQLRPVNPELVRAAVKALADAWNTGALDPMLSQDRFYNKDRLLDTIAEAAPRDAQLTVLSVSGITTLEQYFQPRDGYSHQVSIVSAIVLTQIEFTDPTQGYIRLQGRNEFILEVAHPAPGS